MAFTSNDFGTRALSAALTMALSVGLLAYGGIRADEWLGTSPLFLVLGVLLGATGGLLHLIARLAPEMLPWRRRPPQDPPADDGPAER
jgi:F0F1-type ATP synthase assembly protein I